MSRRAKDKLPPDAGLSAGDNPIVSSSDKGEPVVLTDCRQKRFLFAGMIAALIFGLLGGWWWCVRSPKVAFLTRHSPAQWVVYPRSPDAGMHSVTESKAVFRQTFTLNSLPTKATVSLRALKQFVVSFNGQTVTAPPTANWKDAVELDVTGLLHQGSNQIAVTVLNNDGPQALWLSLMADGFRLNSDGDWEVALDGGDWKKVRLADDPPRIEKGNPLFYTETLGQCLASRWPGLLLFTVLSTGIVLLGARWLKNRPADSPRFALFVLAGLAVCWVVLFANNLGKLPVLFGFDVQGHLEYINFIKTRHSLPLANQGWEMYNPPLYYLICAIPAALLKLDVNSIEATQMFRSFGLVVGIVHFSLIFLCLRRLFPTRLGMQLFGLVLAACLPELLYLSQYVTNESLAAMWVTAAIYFCLRLLKGHAPDWRLALATGLCLGAALLTKVTALIAVPFLGGAMLGWLRLRRIRAIKSWFSTLGWFVVSTLAVCGWHYLRVWKTFGTPLVFVWDSASGFNWWADEGFRTSSYFTRFGRCLTQPLFSGFDGFWDGIYATFWGDGLGGSAASFIARPPWDYELITVSMWLALLPTVMILIGLVVCVRRFFRQPGPVWFLLIGTALASVAALVQINLKVPYNCNVKAFYCLLALLPICAFGAVGWEMLTRRSRRLGLVLGVVFGVWALNVYASYWIRGETYATHFARGMYYSDEQRYEDAAREFSAAVEMEPDSAKAHNNLGNALMILRKLDDAVLQYERAIQLNPDSAEAHYNLGNIFAAQGKLAEAIQHYKLAIQLNPDLAEAHNNLGNILTAQGKLAEAIQHLNQALQLKPDFADAHYNLGVALGKAGKSAEAIQHLERVIQLKPDFTEAHLNLGIMLYNQGKPDEAIQQFRQALSVANAQHNGPLAEIIRARLKLVQTISSPSQTP